MCNSKRREKGRERVICSIPRRIHESLERFARGRNLDLEKLKAELLYAFRDDFVQKDGQFKTDEQRWNFVSGVIKTRYSRRPTYDDLSERVKKQAQGIRQLKVCNNCLRELLGRNPHGIR